MIALCHSINKALINIEENQRFISYCITSGNEEPGGGGLFTDIEGNSLYIKNQTTHYSASINQKELQNNELISYHTGQFEMKGLFL